MLVVDSTHGAVRHELAAGPWDGNVYFAPDGGTLATVVIDLVLWDLATGQERARLGGVDQGRCAWSRDSQWLAVALPNQMVQVHRAADLGAEPVLAIRTRGQLLAFSPDGGQLAIGFADGATSVHALPSGERVRTYRRFGSVESLAWLDDGRLLRLHESPLHLFDQAVLCGLGEADTALHPSARWLAVDARGRLVVCSGAGKVQVLRPGEAPSTLAGRGFCAVHPEGVAWAQVAQGGVVIHEGAERQRVLPLRHRLNPMAVVLVGGGEQVAAWDGGQVKVFRCADGEPVAEAAWHNSNEDLQALVRGAGRQVLRALDPTGARLCVLEKSGFQVRQVEPKQVVAQVPGEWRGFAWLDAHRVLALTSRGGVQIVPVDGSAPSATLQLPGEGWTFGSASGTRAVLWRPDGTIAVVQVDAR